MNYFYPGLQNGPRPMEVGAATFNPSISPVGHYYRTMISGNWFVVLYAGFNPMTQMVTLIALTQTGLQLVVIHRNDLVSWTPIGPNLVLQSTDTLCATYPWAIGC